MIFPLITIILIVGTAFLLRNATVKKSFKNYIFVLIAGVVTFLFEPVSFVLFTNGSADGGAIQIVSTVLGIYAFGWSIVQMFKLKQTPFSSIIKSLFLREDLHLEKRWWHRAFLVSFFLVFVIYAFQIISWSFNYDQKFSKVESISGYINTDVVLLSDIVKKYNKQNYVISENNIIGDGKDSTVFNVYKDTTYCSSDIDKLLIEKGDKVKNLYLKNDKGIRFPVSKDTLIGYMKNNNVQCLALDFYTGENYENVYFLEPIPEIQNLSFYKFSFIKTLLNSLLSISGGIGVFFLAIIFYYKVLLYVIFGSKKHNL